MGKTPDQNMRQYCTDKQWETLVALAETGSVKAAAEKLGVSRATVQGARAAATRKAVNHGYSPDHDLTHPLPDGYKMRGSSTLYDAKTGEAKIQWIKSEIDKERQAEMFREFVAAMTDDIPGVVPMPGPDYTDDSLLACYPVGDHHLGMLSWDKETGADYDLKIGEALLAGATDALMSSMPPCKNALIAFLGDFMHYDSFEAVTPASRNQLDADSRFPKMVRVAIRAMRNLIERAADKHEHVHVIVEIGNHDLSSSIFLMECLHNVYENHPRITVDTSPMHYHYYRYGKVLIGTHHGHGSKMQALPLIMAHDRAKDWGDTEYRHWWTGHIHHSKTQAATSAQDFSGCTVESFRILAPEDAWASQKGYRAISDMKAIVFHREFGEVARHTVNPKMLGIT